MNACAYIPATEAGIEISVRLILPQNIAVDIYANVFGNTVDCKLVHPSNIASGGETIPVKY